jgi:hypothetical protein
LVNTEAKYKSPDRSDRGFVFLDEEILWSRREQNLLYIILALRNIQYTIYINIEFPPVQISQIDPNRIESKYMRSGEILQADSVSSLL